jgi:hypothetical protein
MVADISEAMGYSYLKASIGLSFEAFRAGYRPKKMPMVAAKLNARRIDPKDTKVCMLVNRAVIFDPMIPNATPMSPPTSERATDSMRN